MKARVWETSLFLPRRRASALTMVEDLYDCLGSVVGSRSSAGLHSWYFVPCDPSVRKPFACVKAVEMTTERRLTFLTVCSETLLSVPDQ